MALTTAVVLHWWNFPPYTSYNINSTNSSVTSEWNGDLTGVIPTVLKQVFITCNIIDTEDNMILPITLRPVLNPRAFEDYIHTDPTSLDILMPFTTNNQGVTYLDMPYPVQNNPLSEFISLIDCPGSVHFTKYTDAVAGSDLINVMAQGWPMLVLILLGAGYSGIIIWLLDRLWNPTNFPKPFIRGFWEGFWWAFVTMTTVGYGDTTPRSFQARMFGLIWILVGITILSVFTATVTTVLTQESRDQHHNYIQGKEVGTVNGSEDYRLVVKFGGRPVVLDNFDDLLDQTRNNKILSAVYDQFSFASQQDKTADDFLLENIIYNPVEHGVMIIGPQDSIRTCISTQIKVERGLAFREMVKQITPLTIKTTSDAEHSQNLFQPQTVMYMWYGMALWLAIFISFVAWEFLCWRPKHRKRKVVKQQLNIEHGKEPFDQMSTVSESEDPSCFPKRPSLYTKQEIEAIKQKTLANADKSQLNRQNIEIASPPQTNSSPMLLGQRLRVDVSPRSVGVQRSAHSNNTKKELIEVGNLESLIKRQKVELANLEDELSRYKTEWVSRLKDLKRLHREERRKLLRLMDHDNSIWNETKETESDMSHDKNKPNRSPRPSPVSTLSLKLQNYDNNMLSCGVALPFDDSPVTAI